jgi:hypothetical protein
MVNKNRSAKKTDSQSLLHAVNQYTVTDITEYVPNTTSSPPLTVKWFRKFAQHRPYNNKWKLCNLSKQGD